MLSLAMILALSGCSDDVSSINSAKAGTHKSNTSTSDVTTKKIFYVDLTNITDVEDGNNWETAFSTVQSAIDKAAISGGEVWVAKGTYYPTDGTDRSISFQMKENVAVYGGFTGKETLRDTRNWNQNLTVLSGNIGDKALNSDNSYHVVIAATHAYLDGFTISGGQGSTAGEALHKQSSPTAIVSGLNNNTGIGIAFYKASMDVSNCIIKDNKGDKGAGAYIMTYPDTEIPPAAGTVFDSPTFTNVDFINNVADSRGGGVYVDLVSSPVFIDGKFFGNISATKGGAIYSDYDADPQFYNVLFAENKAYTGSAIALDGSKTAVVLNATIVNNHSTDLGPAIYLGSGPAAVPYVSHSVIWNNKSDLAEDSFETFHGDWIFLNNSTLDKGTGWVGDNVIQIAPNLSGKYEVKNKQLSASAWGWNESLSGKDLRNNFKVANWWLPVTNDGLVVSKLDKVASGQTVVYVDGDAKSGVNGKGWKTAFNTLQNGIDLAYQTGAQVWIAEGSYFPNETLGRKSTFILRDDVEIYGGFKGIESKLEQRSVGLYPTILDGNIGNKTLATDNSYHVVSALDNTVIDGLTITGGYADGTLLDNRGGALTTALRTWDNSFGGHSKGGYNITIANSTFHNNYAELGGAWYAIGKANNTVTNTQFKNNSALYGGALMSKIAVTTTMNDVEFSGNHAEYTGGAAFLDYGSVINGDELQFVDNSAGTSGGAIHLLTRASQEGNSQANIKSTLFANNTAGVNGGAISNTDQSIVQVSKSQFISNVAENKGNDIATTQASYSAVEGISFSNAEIENSEYTDDHSTFESK
ncbi:hypothetical protein DKT75_19490 [Leucothrix arctica]|uniref:Right handed beta helix domain-containing protein n=2 Tax=Leucothrix arctica TaxID=1481894 RepID=A0A317C688_9GAMM|nr:hypothetical protein DKT75_19490 [Leucothrix arctica]